MTTINSITESKPYYVTLFSICRSLQTLRKRRKNSAENFVQGAKKAVKNRKMLEKLKSIFPSGTGRKLAAMALPIFLAFSVASNKVGAEEIQVAAADTTEISLKKGTETETLRKTFSVGLKRLGDVPMDVGNQSAHIFATKGFSVVIYHGSDPHILAGILSGASDAKDTGSPVLGVVTTNGPDADGRVLIYEGFDGQATLVATHLNPKAETVRSQTLGEIKAGHATARQVLSGDGPQASLQGQ